MGHLDESNSLLSGPELGLSRDGGGCENVGHAVHDDTRSQMLCQAQPDLLGPLQTPPMVAPPGSLVA